MKWLLLLLLVGCSAAPFANNEKNITPTQFKIINSSTVDLAFVKWGGQYFCPDEWAGYYGTYYGLLGGHSDTQPVAAGTGYIYFYLNGSDFSQFRTVDSITVAPNQLTSYTILGSTMVTPASVGSWYVRSDETYTYEEVMVLYKK